MWRRSSLRGPLFGLVTTLAALVPACGGITAEHPLTISLGLQRDRVTTELKKHKYCHTADGPAPNLDLYPRCGRVGTEYGESWVTGRFENDRLIELRRYERFSDDVHATERWNQLVTDRNTLTPGSAEADAALRARPLEPGTRTVKAFRVDAETIVGVYLLTPSPPENASILEAIFHIPK